MLDSQTRFKSKPKPRTKEVPESRTDHSFLLFFSVREINLAFMYLVAGAQQLTHLNSWGRGYSCGAFIALELRHFSSMWV